MKRLADLKRRDLVFAVNDEVLLDTRHLRYPSGRKLADKWVGPFTVHRRIGETAYELDLPNTMPNIHDVFHVSLLKPYVRNPHQEPPPVPNFLGTEPQWEVERVLDQREVKVSVNSRRTKREYLVKWKGFGHEDNSWQSEADLKFCKDLIQHYHNSLDMARPIAAS